MAERAEQVSTEKVVAAPPERVFDLLADAARHHLLDGSGNVLGLVEAPPRLFLGATFTMKGKYLVPYTVTNQVVEFEEGRRIGWRNGLHHVWRYELEPFDGGTRVRETYDWSNQRAKALLERVGFPERNLRSMEATLERLAAIAEGRPPGS